MEKAYLENNTKSSNLKIAIVSFPWASLAPYIFLSDIAKIIGQLSEKVFIIGGNTDRIYIGSSQIEVIDIGLGLHYVKNIEPRLYSILLWILKCILVQIVICIQLVKLNKKYDLVLFYMAYPYFLMPLITSKILKKKAIEVVTRSNSNTLISKVLKLQDYFIYHLLDGISPESESLVANLKLKNYENKLLPSGARFIDTSLFSTNFSLESRDNIIGFIGRFSEEKGIMNLVQAIPDILLKYDKLKFLLIGDGYLYNKINKFLKEKNLHDNVKLLGWVDHESLPKYLNEMKLLVLPSYSEGLPTVVLEAMACGTPVLATGVGAMSDIIINGKNGFILKNNSPTCIESTIIEILKNKKTNEISQNANKLIQTKFSFNSAINRYKCILNMRNV